MSNAVQPQRQMNVNTRAQAAPAATAGEQNEFNRLLELPAGERTISYTPFGDDGKIKLTVRIVQDLIATRTKKGATCSERDATRFIMMCVARKLNPFTGDAFLIGYDSQDGPTFSLITAHQAFLKRAEMHHDFDGMESGVIIRSTDGQIIEVEGDFYNPPDETLLGGWARVHHKNRKIPTYRRTRLATFDKGFGRWKDDAGGMIVKCAEADALRSTFPTMLGGLYMEGEISLADFVVNDRHQPVSGNAGARMVETVKAPKPKNGAEPAASEPAKTEPAAEDTSNPELAPVAAKETRIVDAAAATPQNLLRQLVENNGFTWDMFAKWAEQTNAIADCTGFSSFDEIPTERATALLRPTAGIAILKALEGMKKGAA